MPKIVDHAQRRADVIAATWQVIADEGMEATTMRRIAEAAGCSTGLVTHYFDSKEDILVAALHHVFERASKRVHSHLDEPALQALHGVLLDALPLTEEILLEWRVWLIFWSEALTNKYLVAAHDRHYAERAELVSGLLNAARRADEIDPDIDIGIATVQTLACVDGLGIQAVFDPTPATRKLIRLAVLNFIERLTIGRPLPPNISSVALAGRQKPGTRSVDGDLLSELPAPRRERPSRGSAGSVSARRSKT